MNCLTSTYYQTTSNSTFDGTFVGFTSSGKERDEETGYSYFGARYYDAEILMGWLSVDPMADKYPGISPYAYCAWNPIRLVDLEGDSISLTKEAWTVQKQAFWSVFDKKNDKVPFSYNDETQKLNYIGEKEAYTYSDEQKEIINHYKSLCEDSEYNVRVQVVDNDQAILTDNGLSSLLNEFAPGIIANRNDNVADIYISSHPLYKLDGRMMREPQREDHQSIAILHEVGGHAFYHSQGISGTENGKMTTEFENLCRKNFFGKYGSNEIRNGKAVDDH